MTIWADEQNNLSDLNIFSFYVLGYPSVQGAFSQSKKTLIEHFIITYASLQNTYLTYHFKTNNYYF